MAAVRLSILKVIFGGAILFNTITVNAQLSVTEIKEMLDTSTYIPSFYRGALEYNLMVASSKGNTSEINRLISKGADIDAKTDEGATPLILAITNNKLNAVKVLLEYNPNLNTITRNSETPLLIAVKQRYFEITEALIRAGADVDYADRHGATPLHFASIYGYLDIVDLLLYYDASIDLKSQEGLSPLMTSIWAGYPDISDLLIQNGANLESRDNDGFTPFLMAALYGDTLIMDMLYKQGVDIYAINYSNNNALSLSILANHIEATKFLLRIGDKWSDMDKNVVNPYNIASKYQRKEMIDLLKENNIPGKLKYNIDQVSLTPSARFSLHDFYSGLSISFKEPYLNGGFIAGCDMKLWHSRVLVQDSEHLFYQYMEKSSVAYAGLFKDFSLTDRPENRNIYLSTSLLAGYSFGKEFKGTYNSYDNKFMVIPSVSIKVTKIHFTLILGMEYIKTGYYRHGPLWGRLGFSYNFFFDNARNQFKNIRW